MADFTLEVGVVHHLFKNIIHALAVQRQFQALDLEGPVDEVGSDGDLVGKKRIFSVDDLDAIDRDKLQVFKELAAVDVVRELDSRFNRLDQAKDGLDTHSDIHKLGNFSSQQTLEGGVDEGSDLLGGLKPGAEGNLLELSGGGRGEGKNSNGSNADFWVLSGVVNQ